MSEFGGSEHMIQPDASRVPQEAAEAGLYHDSTVDGPTNRSVREAHMVGNRAGLKEARGVPGETVVDPETGVYSFEGYTEEQAREELLDGRND